ncbi:MAG: GAF domain-containing protein, partial [Isosphaeraceae bacterium]
MESVPPNPPSDSTEAARQQPVQPMADPADKTPRRATRQTRPAAKAGKARRSMAPAGSGGTSAVLEASREAESSLAESQSNTRGMIETADAIIRAKTVEEVVRGALDAIRKSFGLAYASYWSVDLDEHALVFNLESGRVDEEFHRHTRSARFREGEGLNGRAWRQRELFFVEDLSTLRDCSRAPLASRAGIRAGIAIPLLRDGQVMGTMDFFAIDSAEFSQTRLDALRTIARLASDKVSTLDKQVELTRITQMVENAPVNMMCTDLDLKIQYMNPHAVKTLKRLEAHLPMKVEHMLGQSIDMF